MKLIERWKNYVGPKDERVENESNKIMRVGYTIFLIGGGIALYYGLMLQQVAETTDNPIFTPLGESIFPMNGLLLIAYLLAVFIPVFMFARKGIMFEHTRFEEFDRIPWDYVVMMSVVIAVILGVLTSSMRIAAEIQIVGLGEVAWFGDVAMGIVYAGMGFALGIVVLSLNCKMAIDKRRKVEQEFDD